MSQLGKDDLCPCGSGAKFGECHGAKAAPKEREEPNLAAVAREPHAPEAYDHSDDTHEAPIETKPRARLVAIRTAPSESERAASERRKARFTAPGPKKLVLAYPAYSSITAPPLGVAYLKGHVQRELPEWSVKVVDLNVEAHERFFSELGARRMLAWDEGLAGEIALSRAAEVFRGEHPDDFHRTDRMIYYSQLWNRALRSTLHKPREYQAAFLGRAEVPREIRRQADILLAEQPTAIGVSACYVEQFWGSLCLLKVLRERAPHVPLIVGGTMFKEGIDEAWSAEGWPVDYIVAGAGEDPLVEILRGNAENGAIPGVTLVGAQLRTVPPNYDADFDAVSDPDFSDFDTAKYFSPKPIFPMQTTRGCYWKRCTFCNHYKTVGGSYQLRSMDRLIGELGRHVAAGVRHFTFVDDIISPARFNNMSKAILEAGLQIRYHAMTRPMKHFTREVLQRMYDAGCRFILWGVESGSQRVLDAMEKGTVVAEVEQCLKLSAEVGIKNHVFIICGFPTETLAEWKETLAFLARVRPWVHAVHKTMFGLERGTPVFDDPARFKITRVWPKGTTLLYDFECAEGMTRAEATKALDDARPFFRSFAAGKELEQGDFRFRDHLLLLYCKDEVLDDVPLRYVSK